MKKLRSRKYLLALMALLVVFAGCKGESPTAPPPGSGPGTPPGGTPPSNSGIAITLSASTLNPLTNSSSTITATVTQNGNPVPNGTAVEFGASGAGRFSDTGTGTSVRTTTNGVATAIVTAATSGPVTVSAVVGSTVQQITVNFVAQPVTPPPPNTASTITSITPGSGAPTGGEIITITGTNFRTPVRAFFDLGGGVLREAQIISVTPTQIQLFTPQIDLGAGQQTEAAIILFVEQGTPNEQRVTSSSPFTFRRAQLTPIITTLSPASGPVEGGTRVTIFGEGFEYPLQVFFGAAEAQIVNVTFSQIIAVAPSGRDASPTGETSVTGTVPVRIININSNTSGELAGGFRYAPAMAITATGPGTGSSLGGTRITIDGIGFDDPVAVSVGSGTSAVALQPVFVSGTKIIAVTPPLVSPCDTATGAITVTNINTGISAQGGGFTFQPITPIIVGVSPSAGVQPGGTLTVSVDNPGVGSLGSAYPRFTINGRNITPTPSTITVGVGTQPFTVVVPTTGFNFPTEQCTTATSLPGTRFGSIETPLTFVNLTTGCDADPTTVTILPPSPNTCLRPPSASTSPTGVAPACVNVGTIAQGASNSATLTVSNGVDTQPLIITNAAVSGTPVGGTISVAPSGGTVPSGGSINLTVTASPNACTPTAPATTCPITGTITLTTNDPQRGSIQICVTGQAAP